MPTDNQNPNAPQAGEEGNKPQAGNEETTKPQAGDVENDTANNDTPTDGLTPDAKAKIQKANKEAQTLRERAKAAEAELAKYKDKEKTDTERATDAAKSAETQATTLKAKLLNKSVEIAAKDAGAKDAKVIAKLLDQSAIEYDDEGEPTNLEALIAELKATSDYLFNPTEKPATAPPVKPTNPSSGQQGKGVITQEIFSKMTPGEINARWDEISVLLAAGKLRRR
jgi:hypothetical protein